VAIFEKLHFRNSHHASFLGVPHCCRKCTSVAGLGIITSLLTTSKWPLHSSLPKRKDKM